VYITVLMDVEDLVDPEADDLAGICADILWEEGVAATFCVVGEKARLLKARGRHDVIQKMARHDIGYHTNFHSVHPTISEYLAPLSFEEGVEEALRQEQGGIQAINDVFGMSPSCFGGPGNTWGPAVCEALRKSGVPSFVYAHTEAPGGGPHRFCGLHAYPNGRGLSDGLYQDTAAAAEQLSELAAGIAADVAGGLFWQQAFIGHPTRILHEHFWDDPNFVRGANPPRSEWKMAARKSDTDLETALINFRKAARAFRELPGVEIKTIREMNAILDAQGFMPAAPDQLQALWPSIEARLLGMAGWPIVPEDIDLSRICEQTQQLLPTIGVLQKGSVG
jgi:hypothetical protein